MIASQPVAAAASTIASARSRLPLWLPRQLADHIRRMSRPDPAAGDGDHGASRVPPLRGEGGRRAAADGCGIRRDSERSQRGHDTPTLPMLMHRRPSPSKGEGAVIRCTPSTSASAPATRSTSAVLHRRIERQREAAGVPGVGAGQVGRRRSGRRSRAGGGPGCSGPGCRSPRAFSAAITSARAVPAAVEVDQHGHQVQRRVGPGRPRGDPDQRRQRRQRGLVARAPARGGAR